MEMQQQFRKRKSIRTFHVFLSFTLDNQEVVKYNKSKFFFLLRIYSPICVNKLYWRLYQNFTPSSSSSSLGRSAAQITEQVAAKDCQSLDRYTFAFSLVDQNVKDPLENSHLQGDNYMQLPIGLGLHKTIPYTIPPHRITHSLIEFISSSFTSKIIE
jgi:hypothetical protein